MTRESIIAQLASSSGHNDQSANIELAEKLSRAKDEVAIGLLADIVQTGTSAQKKDALKVLYEIGARQPGLITAHTDVFFENIESSDNRIVWGSLMALARISSQAPEKVADRLSPILKAADNGSVIAKDQAIEILIAVKALPNRRQAASLELFERLRGSAINQLPKYAEQIFKSLRPEEKVEFLAILDMRLTEHMPDAKRRRLHKLKHAADETNDGV